MKIFDVSLVINAEMPVWEGDPKPCIEAEISRSERGRVQVSSIRMGAHTGTHIDAPLHFIEYGNSIEKIPLHSLLGRCMVVEVPDSNGEILVESLTDSGIHKGVDRILFKTRNTKIWERAEKQFTKQFVSLSAEAADYLIDLGVKVIGIDYLSIASFSDPYPVHQKLLGKGIVVIEGLNLNEVPPGNYLLIALPLRLEGAEGAPARVVLLDDFEHW